MTPLLHTVVDILRLRQTEQHERDRESGHSPSSDEACHEGTHHHHVLAAAEAPAEGENQDHQQRREQEEEVFPSRPEQGGQGSPSMFLLAFARRNVSIERVLREAESLGLAWTVPDDFEPATASENIYLMSLR